MKNTILTGFQKTYINEFKKKCGFLKIVGCIYINDNNKNLDNLDFSFDRDELRAGNVIKHDYRINYDNKIIGETHPYLVNALTLFDRYDVNGVIPTSDRLGIIYTNVSFWLDLIKNYNVEVVVSREIPHFVHEYCLYIACNISKVNILMFDYVEHLVRTLCINNIEERGISFNSSNHEDVKKSTDLLNILRSSHEEAIKNSEVPKISSFWKKWSVSSWLNYFLRDILSIIKYSLKKSPISILLTKKQYLRKERANHFLVRLFFFKLRFKVFSLELLYRKLTRLFSLDKYKDKKLIVFFANYQPERTTNPDGGYFFDTLNVIKLISNSLPSDYKLLYKEHPHTFSPPYKDLYRGALFRNKDFYTTIEKLDVDMVPTSFDTYKLMRMSELTISINGTVLIESVVNGTPGIIFGNSWIESLPGITKINSANSLKEYFNVIEQNKNISDSDIVNIFCNVYGSSIPYINLLNNIRSFNSMEKEISELLKYIENKV